MIEVKNISKAYQGNVVLHNVSLRIPKGNIVSMIGANGAGKSTLLSIISRLMAGQGSVEIDGRPINDYKDDELSKKISVLRQTNHLNVRLTVRELVAFGRYPYTRSRLTKADQKIIDNAISYMELDSLSERFIDELSGGERQRTLISMIIAQDTEYILLDEPLNNLDMKHSVQIMKLIRKLVDEHEKTVILVIHDINFASCYSDYIFALKNGHLLFEGKTAEVITPDVLREVYDMDFKIEKMGGNRICLYFT